MIKELVSSLGLHSAMLTRLVSTLDAFFCPAPLLSLLPSWSTWLLFAVFTAVVVGGCVRVGRAGAEAAGPGPGRLPCLPRLPLLGSLPWLGGDLPPHLLFSRLGHR